jgi:DNA-binding response OmpR family regulator
MLLSKCPPILVPPKESMEEHILLVEDEADLRTTLVDRLESETYTVECASDGEEGYQKALH